MRLIASIKRNDIFASNGKPALHFCRGLCVSLQNLNISLFLLFFWAPFNLPSYLLGVSVGLSAVCCLLLPKGEIKASLSCWKPFLPLLALFVLLCLTIFYACNRTAAIASCAGQLAFLLIPFVFFGMSPVFFSPGRIRSFSFLLVIGSLIEVIVRAVVLTRCFLSVPELENYRLAGFWPSLNEFLSFQAIYMSFAGMKMPMHTTIEALFINTAFIIVFLARIYGNRFLSTPLRRRLADISLFLFAVSLLTSNSKTGQTMFVLSLLCLIVLAFCRHRRHLDDEALYWIARESTGSMRDAYTLFDQVAAFSENHITYEKIRDKLGLVGTERLNALFEECAAQNVSGVQEKLGDFLQAGISIEQLITNSADYLRSLLLVKNGVTKESLLGQDAARFSQKVLSAWNSVQLERALSIFLQLYRDIRYSLSPRYEIDLAFSRLCWLGEYVSPAEVKQAVDKARALLESPPQNATQTQGGTQQSFSDGAENAQSGAPKEFHFAPLRFSQELNSENLAEANSIRQNSNSENSGEQNFSEKQNPQENSPRQEFAQDAPIDDSLRGKAIAALLVDDEVSASLLKNTKNWRASGETILAEVSDEFQKNQIDAKIQIINKAVSAAFGGNYFFQARVAATSEQNSQTEIPQVVNTLCKVFKGTVIGGGIA